MPRPLLAFTAGAIYATRIRPVTASDRDYDSVPTNGLSYDLHNELNTVWVPDKNCQRNSDVHVVEDPKRRLLDHAKPEPIQHDIFHAFKLPRTHKVRPRHRA